MAILYAPYYYNYERIRFNNSTTIYRATIYRYGSLCGIIFDQEYENIPSDLTELDTSYFELSVNDELIYGKFWGYSTIYKIIDDGFILSNDGSVCVEPPVIEPEEPVEPPVTETTIESSTEQSTVDLSKN